MIWPDFMGGCVRSDFFGKKSWNIDFFGFWTHFCIWSKSPRKVILASQNDVSDDISSEKLNLQLETLENRHILQFSDEISEHQKSWNIDFFRFWTHFCIWSKSSRKIILASQNDVSDDISSGEAYFSWKTTEKPRAARGFSWEICFEAESSARPIPSHARKVPFGCRLLRAPSARPLIYIYI